MDSSDTFSDLTGKSLQFDKLLAHPTFWEQIWFDEKERDGDLPEPVKLHQPHLISGKDIDVIKDTIYTKLALMP